MHNGMTYDSYMMLYTISPTVSKYIYSASLMHNSVCLYRVGCTEQCAGAASHALCMEDFQRLLQQHLG